MDRVAGNRTTGWPEAVAIRLLKLARRAVPADLRRRGRLAMFQWLNQTWRLPSGVSIRVSSYHDWMLYNEVFVSGEYDAAIERALDQIAPPTPLRVLDLGANVGYFTLRVVDCLRRRSPAGDVFITLVEGDADLIDELRTRVSVENALADQTTMVHGLVGRRSGVAALDGTSSIVSDSGPSGPPTAFVDLSELPGVSEGVDLLKCDIEGAELLFIQHYPDLLRRTRVAIFELHPQLCDPTLCQRLLKEEAGFPHGITLRERAENAIYCAWR